MMWNRAAAFSFASLAMLFYLVVCGRLLSSVHATEPSRCKYSVRDVAFVNVHGKPWQLQLIKPVNVPLQQFESWNAILKSRLADSNVGFIWHDSDSDQAMRLVERASIVKVAAAMEPPLMFLTGPDEEAIPCSRSQAAISFDQQIGRLIDSPIRQEILHQLVDSLCVIVLVESGDEPDGHAVETLNSAIDQVHKQMWAMEKPTEKGPALVRLSVDQAAGEAWLLKSLGIRNQGLPAVAVVYGQGRRLGDVLTGADIAVEKIVGRVSICGRDCECDLDRDWLYRTQLIHVWSSELERKAESSLSFDPRSGWVIAEVAQILQKNRTRLAADERVDLGGGLLIHDLDPITRSDPELGLFSVEKDGAVAAEAADALAESEGHPSVIENSKPVIPWFLLIGMTIALVAIFSWLGRTAAKPR